MRLNIINIMIRTLTLATLLFLSNTLAIRIGQEATDIEEVPLDALKSTDAASDLTTEDTDLTSLLNETLESAEGDGSLSYKKRGCRCKHKPWGCKHKKCRCKHKPWGCKHKKCRC